MLSNIFEKSARSVTSQDAVKWLQSQTGYGQFDHLPKYFIHDLMHILADATLPTGANERRSGIMEYYMLPVSLQVSKIENDRLVRLEPDPEMDAIGKAYADNGRNSLRQEIETYKNRHTETGDVSFLKAAEKLEFFLTPHDLTPHERECAIIRAQSLSRYFREQNGGRKLGDFTVSEMRNMTLPDLGIIPVKTESGIRFEALMDIPAPVFS